MARRFNKFGLRRDLNFSDLANPQQSLNNLLNGLVDIDGESFIYQDIDTIKDIGATSMVNGDFRRIAGAALRVTGTDGQLAVYKPIVKFKNRLDVAKFTIGEEAFYGGDGLTSRYYPSIQIDSTADSASNIFTGEPLTLYTNPETGATSNKEVFWERGIFDFISKINPQLPDIYGGVSWTGYFRPTSSGKWGFQISTTGFYTFEIDYGDGNYILVGRKSQKSTSIAVSPATAGASTLFFATPADIAKVFVGDVLIHPTIPQFADAAAVNYAGAVTVDNMDYAAGSITISSPLTSDITTATDLTFRHRVGDISGTLRYTTSNLEQYRTYKIRYRFWVPNIADVSPRALKQLTLTVAPPGGTLTYLNYKWLYSEDYIIDPAEGTTSYGDFRKYYTTKIDSGGGTIGGSAYADYQSVITKAPLNVSYTPPANIATVTAQTKTVALFTNSNSLEISRTDGIATGQYAFGSGITNGTRVKSVSVNQGVFLTANPTSSITSTITFIDHRGLVAYEWLSANTTNNAKAILVSAATYAAVNIGDIATGSNIPTNYTTVVRKSASIDTNPLLSVYSIIVSDVLNSTSTTASVFFYKPKGVLNNALTTFCNNVVAAPTVATSSAAIGSSTRSTLTLAYVDGIDIGDVAQFGTRISSGTTVTNVNSSTKVVTLSVPITDDIPVGQLITFAPAGTTENKEICFPPIDTSPPFTATSLGLTTTSGRPSINIAPLSGATGQLKFVGLSADGVATPTALSLTGTAPSYTRTLTIKDGTGTLYKILATT